MKSTHGQLHQKSIIQGLENISFNFLNKIFNNPTESESSICLSTVKMKLNITSCFKYHLEIKYLENSGKLIHPRANMCFSESPYLEAFLKCIIGSFVFLQNTEHHLTSSGRLGVINVLESIIVSLLWWQIVNGHFYCHLSSCHSICQSGLSSSLLENITANHEC